MNAQDVLLTTVLRDPGLTRHLRLGDWELLIRQARRSGLLSRLADRIESEDVLSAAPEAARIHFEEAKTLSAKHARDVRWEVRNLRRILGSLVDRLILLKGAAYEMAGLPPAQGRIFSDIDLLVPRAALDQIERHLRDHGWGNGDLDPYDDRYYRRFSHQIPPLTHFIRGTTLDVHHTIIQPTARDAVPAEPLIEAALPLPTEADIAVLQPTDMVLHSASHLFSDGEFNRGLRDLDDLNLLLRHFATQADFWPTLVARAEALGLMRPLAYALHYTSTLLGTPIPVERLALNKLAGPGRVRMAVLDTLFTRALTPDHPSCRGLLDNAAVGLLYVRAHYLRMPLHLLLPHLAHKALRSEHQGSEASVTDVKARLNLPGGTAQSRGHG